MDIYGHVTCLRAQRNYSVQTEEQYAFVYATVTEAWAAGRTEVAASALCTRLQRLTAPVRETESVTAVESETGTALAGSTGLQAEFKVRRMLRHVGNEMHWEFIKWKGSVEVQGKAFQQKGQIKNNKQTLIS